MNNIIERDTIADEGNAKDFESFSSHPRGAADEAAGQAPIKAFKAGFPELGGTAE
jgi:hypothetical protein